MAELHSFQSTRWTLVRRTRGSSEEAKAALSELCAIYYEPVFAFVTRWTGGGADARDLVHGFFEDVLAREVIGETADPSRGRFRGYLLGAVKHFLMKHRSREQAAKRGGGVMPVSLEDSEPGAWEDAAAELAFDRDWASSLIGRAVENLRAEMSESGKSKQFETLKPWLDGGSPGSLEAAGLELGMNANALNVAIHRFRQRFLKLVRYEVESTVADPGEATEEFRHLVNVLVAAR
ncbi:MAG: sigma-70 family RNA polymerase sigma factor [Luteolibacter sp.]